MDYLNKKICEAYNNGKTISYIRGMLKAKRVFVKDIVKALIEDHTSVMYNRESNQYDSIVIPSKINYNIRIYGKAKLHNSKR